MRCGACVCCRIGQYRAILRWGAGAMRLRVLALLCVLVLIGCRGTTRYEGFAATGPADFLYSAHTNPLITQPGRGGAATSRPGAGLSAAPPLPAGPPPRPSRRDAERLMRSAVIVVVPVDAV